ncbi:MAG: YaaA family protein [Propionibacteriaceae bacterium]
MPVQPLARARSRLIMIVLLPPSEGKATARRRGTPVRLDRLTLPELRDARRRVLSALVGASARPDAATVLKVGAGQAAEVAANLTLARTPAAPAAAVYTGVLYDALDLASLPAPVRARASRTVLVQSALWGPVSVADRIAPYRLSMGVSLPGLGPLAGYWRAVLDGLMPTVVGHQVVVDCRSSTYAAAWRPSGDVARRTVAVRVWTETAGARTVVSHHAKHTRGLVARWLLEAGSVRSVGAVAEVVGTRMPCELVDLGRSGWALDVVTGVVTR